MNRRRSRPNVLVGALLGMALLVGCGKREPGDTGTAPSDRGRGSGKAEEKVIGFSVVDMQPNFFQDMERGTREAAKEMGYKYILHDQKYDPALMVSGCENLMTQGIDALIVSPNEPSALGPVVKKAKDRGVPVVIDDIGGGNSDYDVIVISDCYGGGVIAADYMAGQLAKRQSASKEVGILKCMPGHVYAVRRGQGFKARMEELGHKTYELTANDVRDQGYRVTQDLMTAHPKIVGIFCENDPMALGAVQAIRDSGKSAIDDVLVVGFNADPEAVEAIRAGIMDATIRQAPYQMGRQCVMLADKLLKGEKLEYTDPKLREITVPVGLVTRENVGEILPSGK